MPPRETLAAFGATRATLVLHLSIQALDRVVAELIPSYGADCPIAVVVRATWPDERIVRATLGTILQEIAKEPPERSALIIVGEALGVGRFPRQRALRRELSPPLSRRRSVVNARRNRMADQAAIAVEHRDLKLDRRIAKHLRRACPGRLGDRVSERDAIVLRMTEGLCGRVRRDDAPRQRLRPARLTSKPRERGQIDAASRRMQIEQPLRELRHLADAAGNGDVRQSDAL